MVEMRVFIIILEGFGWILMGILFKLMEVGFCMMIDHQCTIGMVNIKMGPLIMLTKRLQPGLTS